MLAFHSAPAYSTVALHVYTYWIKATVDSRSLMIRLCEVRIPSSVCLVQLSGPEQYGLRCHGPAGRPLDRPDNSGTPLYSGRASSCLCSIGDRHVEYLSPRPAPLAPISGTGGSLGPGRCAEPSLGPYHACTQSGTATFIKWVTLAPIRGQVSRRVRNRQCYKPHLSATPTV